MALISCPECKREISDQATSCPHCGFVIKGKGGGDFQHPGCAKKLFGWILFFVFLAIVGFVSDSNKPKQQQDENSEPEKEYIPAPDLIELNAKVYPSPTQLKIVNEDNFKWKNVIVTVNPVIFGTDYKHKITALEPQKGIIIDLVEFYSGTGDRFNPALKKVLKVKINCETEKGRAWFFCGIAE